MNFQTPSALPFALGNVSYLDLACPRSQQPARKRAMARATASVLLPSTVLAAPSATAATVDSLRFALHQAPEGTGYLHLSLFDNDQELAQWELPGSARSVVSAVAAPTYLVECAQPLAAAQILDEGYFRPANGQLQHARQEFEQGLRSGYLQLTLSGRELRGEFSLLRLQPNGNRWELYCQPSLTKRLARAWA